MAIKIISIIAALATLFGGAGAGTVYAAQSSLPGDALYPVKIWSEEVRLDASQDPDQDLALHLVFADRRIGEMLALTQQGQAPDNELNIALQTHLWMAAQLTGSCEDPLQAQAMLRTRLMSQEMKLTHAPEDALMTQTRAMLRQQIQLMECTTEDCEQQVCEGGGCLTGDSLMTQDQIREQLRTDQPEGAGNPDANGFTGNYPEPQQGKDEQEESGTDNGSQNGMGGNQNADQIGKTPVPGDGQQNGNGNGNGK
ncbi:MAG: hypothetical protein HPY85_14860 [Anaerolineae bacterium]|nr:hypothetical protein [Anaerolineae bacterium]